MIGLKNFLYCPSYAWKFSNLS